MKERKYETYVADFETTVYEGQEETEVWGAAIVKLNTEEVEVFTNIDDFMEYMFSLKKNLKVYFHNLKFDGEFITAWLLRNYKFKQAIVYVNKKPTFKRDKNMNNYEWKLNVSDMGQWYYITIKINNIIIQIQDSLKLLPFSVQKIGDSFKLKHRKGMIDYVGERRAGGTITDNEKEYIANDVLVIKEALEYMYSHGHDRLTIGSCCFAEYKRLAQLEDGVLNWNEKFPDLTQIKIDKDRYGVENADCFIRKSYRGGWCHVKKGCEGKVIREGCVTDVNSLYPSVMHSMSGNYYPIGTPYFWQGNTIPEVAYKNNHYYFVRIRTRFYLKKGHLPFLQIKNNYMYRGNECLETSDILNKGDGKYYPYYLDGLGNKISTTREMVLTMTDYELMKEHYDLVDLEIMGGCWFYTQKGIFDSYLNKYRKIKMESTGALRELSKLFQNNLYGKLATSPDSSYKIAHLEDDGIVHYENIEAYDKQPGYIAIGSAITSYARNFTIRAAQKNYKHFIYSDTDSLHCSCRSNELIGIKLHQTEYCAWKIENEWNEAIFVRQKTYIEHNNDGGYNIKCAGMSKRPKELFEMSLQGKQTPEDAKTPEEYLFLFDENGNPIKRHLTDFTHGLIIPSKLIPKRIKGGIVLTNTTYELR